METFQDPITLERKHTDGPVLSPDDRNPRTV
jgi:hypothetical protein